MLHTLKKVVCSILYRQEKGVATILTIGILALLAALSIGFLSETITLQKISNNSLNLERARLLAQSMIQRSIAAVSEYNHTTSAALIKFHSQHIDGDTTAVDELNTAISTTYNYIEYYSWDQTSSDSPHWQYIRTERNSNGDSMLIGRITYVTVNNIGKLDPSVSIDSGGNANNNSVFAVSETSITNTSTDTEGNYILGRPGREMSEIFLANLDPGGYIDADTLIAMSAENADPAGKLTTGRRWFDVSEFLGAIGITGSSEEDIDIRTRYNNWFTTDNHPDPEAFWIDLDEDDIIDSQYEQFHRFNLTRTDWDTLSVSDLTSADTVLYTSTYSDAGVKSIPWLINWKNTGDMDSVTNARNQIIANLIDYCDSNDTATSDYPDSDPPTYVGLEKIPYINEIKLTITGEVYEATWKFLYFFTFYKYRVNINVDECVLELINMYDISSSNITAEVSINYDYTWSVTGIMGFEETEKVKYISTETSLSPVTGDITFASVPSTNYITETINNIISTCNWKETYSSEHCSDLSITKFKIKELIIKLKDESGNLLDYACIINIGNTKEMTLSDDGTPYTVYFSAQVKDPRQNLLEDDWSDSHFCESGDYSDTFNTLGYVNTHSNPSGSCGTDSDIETDTNPISISTAYIRNAPMKSPWELGFIHRAKAWQTLNLKKYNDSDNAGCYKDSGGNDYSDGDANILDQIKMTSNTETYGKVNINAANFTTDPPAEIYQALYQNIYLTNKADYGTPGEQTGTQVTKDNANTIGNALINAAYSSSGIFKTRAQIVRPTNGVEELYNGTVTQQTNAQQEAIIGKTVNLTKGGTSNNLTLIAVAQTIKDVGGDISAANDPGANVTKNGKTKLLKYNEYVPGYDTILAEQKVFVVLIRDPITFKWEIKKLKYLNL